MTPPELWPALLCGAVVGLSLGLTGGGGSIFAVPLLVYVLGTGVREAVGISLATVGATSLLGAALRHRARLVEWMPALVFAGTGIVGAPLGTWIGASLPDSFTLAGFAFLMLFVGIRMWKTKDESVFNPRHVPCARTETNEIHLTGRCVATLSGTGLLVGVLTGIFGVGGGFIIVPALVFVTGMTIHRAVATSLFVIAVICASGVSAYLLGDGRLPPSLSLAFLAGGFAGMIAGHSLCSRLNSDMLKRAFAVAMWAVALFVLARTALERFHPSAPPVDPLRSAQAWRST